MIKQENSGIYLIEHIASGRQYVGSSVDIKARWRDHLCRLRKNYHHSVYLQRSWNKYGKDAFVFKIIEVVELPEDFETLSKDQKEQFAKEVLLLKEQWYLDNWKVVFNFCRVAGSCLGSSYFTVLNKQRIGLPLSEEHRKNVGDSIRGLKRSEETRKRISASKRGKTVNLTPEQRQHASDVQKGKKNPKLAELNKSRIGSKHKPETIEKMRQAAKKRKASMNLGEVV